MTLDVLCVGVVTVDTIATVAAMPGADERVLSSAAFVQAGGGPAATAAVALARQGRSVGFCGVVGDDAAGELSRALLEAEGVDTRWLITRPGVTTTQSMIIVSGTRADRAIVTTGSVPVGPADVPTDVSRWLHVDQAGYAPARAALAARPSDALLSIDAGNPIDGLGLDGVELFAPTVASLAEVFPGDVRTGLAAARAAGARQVVATAGAEGTWVLSGDDAVLVPGVGIVPVSTMGAGDVFHGALLASLVAGEDLEAAVRRANVVAALSCRSIDGRSGIPTASEVQHYLSA